MSVLADLAAHLRAARRERLRGLLRNLGGAPAPASSRRPTASSRQRAEAAPVVETLLDRLRQQKAERAAVALSHRAPPVAPEEAPPASSARARISHRVPLQVLEPRTDAARQRANVAAMALAAELARAPRALTEDDRRTLAAYTGWGGLSIRDAAGKFPRGFPVPEARGLIHEYYTPSEVCAEVARVVAPLLPGLASADGRVLALEPAAGIGRFVRAFEGPGFEAIDWRVVEYSALSAAMLHALRPDIDLHEGSFESWVAKHEHALSGRVNLVVSNPPYGKRGPSITDDPVRAYRDNPNAYAYFLRRGLDLLVAGGLGVYLIPSGFLSGMGAQNVALRTQVLRRHHLAAAYRLPSGLFPGTQIVTDLLLFRARGGTLLEVAESDRFILEGLYFNQFPSHVLGTPEGEESDGDEHEGGDGETAPRPRSAWARYRVIGTFSRLPDLHERPMCDACGIAPTPAPRPRREPAAPPRRLSDTAEPRLVSASSLGHRVDAFLTAVAAQDNEEPSLVWQELLRSLVEWARAHGPPSLDAEVMKLAKDGDVGAQRFIAAFEPRSTQPIPALMTRPTWTPRYQGRAGDVVAYAEFLYRQHRRLRRAELGSADLAPLFAAGWCEDEPGELVPPDVYFTGDLWPKHDRAKARAARGDRQAAAQVQKLLTRIAPAMFDEIDISPRHGWVPLDLVEAWMTTELNLGNPIKLERSGVLQREGIKYEDIETGISPEALWCIGWINHDRTLFRPKRKSKDEAPDDARLRIARLWEESFRAWCAVDETRRQRIEIAHQRHFQGFKAPTYSTAPIALARWTKAGPKLHAFQAAGVRRVLANRGGLIAYDVGLGKTYTGLAVLAAARQEGWAQRPVIVVPNSIVWKWAKDIARVLPDYRVGVIGSKRKLVKGVWSSETDTPAERAATWARFQGGEYDVVLLTYSAMPRTRIDPAFVKSYAEGVTAIARQVILRQRNAKKKNGDLTEREEAILAEGVAAWCAEQTELPEGWQFDPGISWEGIGVDLLIVDEAQNYKNKHMPEPREGGVPRFMGSPGDGSKRAWQLEFRCAVIRQKTGGAGIVLLSATPAKNGPLEFLTIIEYIDPDAFARLGITDPEKFVDYFCKLEMRMVVNAKMEAEPRSAVVGFKHMDALRDVVFRYGEFLTAEQVGRWIGIATDGSATANLDEPGVRASWPSETAAAAALRGAFQGARGPRSSRSDGAPSAKPVLSVRDLGPVRGVKPRERPAGSGAWGLWLPGMKLPEPVVELIEVDMDARQEAKYARYVGEIESILSKEKRGSVLGFLARMGMVAVHADLDEGYIWMEPKKPKTAAQERAQEARAARGKAARRGLHHEDDDEGDDKIPKKDAREVPSPHSPKFDALTREILRQPTCGHIVFVDNTAAHKWVQMVLIEAGIPAERIAVLNGIVAEAAADRQRIAEQFNGVREERDGDGNIITPAVAPRFDVVICNQIAHEGVDLQTRTCAIHHLDLPWEPATLQQRNGRGVRQGNQGDTIAIKYYFARRSMDGMRFGLIDGKRTWMSELIEGQKRETNNPGAQSSLGADEILMLISRDPEKTRAKLDALRAKVEAEARAKIAEEASKSLQGAVSRFARAKTASNPEDAARLRSEAEQRLVDLGHVDPVAWPWAPWVWAARDRAMLVPSHGGSPVYEGLRVEAPGLIDPAKREYAEFGKVRGATIGVRSPGSPVWRVTSLDDVVKMKLRPEHATTAWPTEDVEIARAMRVFIPRFRSGAAAAWTELGWERATDAFVERHWPAYGGDIIHAMLSDYGETPGVPVLVGGKLQLGLDEGQNVVIPPTKAGYQEFLRLAPASGLKFTELEKSASWWWNRWIPKNLLSTAREAAAARATQSAGPPSLHAPEAGPATSRRAPQAPSGAASTRAAGGALADALSAGSRRLEALRDAIGILG